MKIVRDFLWKPNMSVEECVNAFGNLGFQASELNEAVNVVMKMKKAGSKIFLTFTSNMATSGLRGFFAQLCKLKIPNVLVTTSGAIEEDIMKAIGEDFNLSSFYADDTAMHERGENRVGNLLIRNESYMKFEDLMNECLGRVYEKLQTYSSLPHCDPEPNSRCRTDFSNLREISLPQLPTSHESFCAGDTFYHKIARPPCLKPNYARDGVARQFVAKKFPVESHSAKSLAPARKEDNCSCVNESAKRISVSELLYEIGLMVKDENSILHQAARNGIPIYCPGIADSSFGFQLFMFQEKHPDFMVDTIYDMKRVVSDLGFDERKGLISLGGSISKHYAVFAALLSGGFDYAVYMTTSHASSGSMSGATTEEAKSWGKIKDSGEAATVNGDVTITFPLMMCSVLDKLRREGILENERS